MRDSARWGRLSACGGLSGRLHRFIQTGGAASPAQAESLPHNGMSGFTLLEVLVATIIMAVAISGLLSALTTSMNNAARLTDHDRAITLARQQMNDLLVTNTVPKDSPLQGAWDPALTGGRRCGWNGMVSVFEAPAGAAEGDPDLDRVHSGSVVRRR
jgi:general secretion pathway protein I